MRKIGVKHVHLDILLHSVGIPVGILFATRMNYYAGRLDCIAENVAWGEREFEMKV